MEPRPVVGAVPVERVILNNFPKGYEVIFQEVWLKEIYLGLWEALRMSFNLTGVLRTVYNVGHTEVFLVNVITNYRQEWTLQGFCCLG